MVSPPMPTLLRSSFARRSSLRLPDLWSGPGLRPSGFAPRRPLRHPFQPNYPYENQSNIKKMPKVVRHLIKKDIHELDPDQDRPHPYRQRRRRRDILHRLGNKIDIPQSENYIADKRPHRSPIGWLGKKAPPMHGL